jgi:predicted transcriptional regulator
MTRIPDFDLDDMLGVLNSVIEDYAEGSKERDAAKLAQIALLYIRDGKKGGRFCQILQGVL